MTKMSKTRRLFLLVLLMLVLPVQAAVDQYACFSHPKSRPLKMKIEGAKVTFSHPANGQISAYSETIEFLRLELDYDSRNFIASTNKSPCTLIQNTYQLGLHSTAYCWKEETQELYVDRQNFEEDGINRSTPDDIWHSTTRYDCVALD